MRTPKRFFFLMFFFLIFAGCGQPSPLSSTERAPTAAAPAVARLTNTLIPSPTSTLTNTPSPTLPLETPTQTPTRILPPLPTLSAEGAQLELARLMRTNGDCSGECFWGITPGVTNYTDAFRFLRRIDGEGFRESDQYADSYSYNEDKINVDLTMARIDSKVLSLSATLNGVGRLDVTGEDWLAFRPDQFLKTHGVPARVNVVIIEGPEGRLTYDLLFHFSRMYIQYSGN